MDGETIQQVATARAGELPGAALEHPFGPDWDVFKVRGRVLMLQTRVTGEPIVTLKASPDDAVALRAAYAEITPGYHMNKRHWVTLSEGSTIDAQLVEDLVTESYLLVLEQSVPRSMWPVDPRTFARRADERG